MKKNPMTDQAPQNTHLKIRRVGIETYQEPVVYMRLDCPVCRAEGFEAQARVKVRNGKHSIIATLNVVTGEWLQIFEAGLSEIAWHLLQADEGSTVEISHPDPLDSLAYVRAKVYGRRMDDRAMSAVIRDIVAGLYADVHLSSFITACAANRLDLHEITSLTRAMVEVGDRITWSTEQVMDKHCIGGLPGNRTTLIVVPIVAAFGLMIPKTSSRAITSPAGSADVMETLAPVQLNVETLKKVVELEGACIAWGGAVRLSPADDILIRVERPLDLDSEGQMVASILSKKIAAGATHVLIDIPCGATAKVRSPESAEKLGQDLRAVGDELGIHVQYLVTDGTQPVGNGIGPALEAHDVVSVLQNRPGAVPDLRQRALELAGKVIELSGKIEPGQGFVIARRILEEGRAWKKFQSICEAQGGMREPPRALYLFDVPSAKSGRVTGIDNRLLARVAKLAGAPRAVSAGVYVHAHLGDVISKGEPLFTIHAESPGELNYARRYVESHPGIYHTEE